MIRKWPKVHKKSNVSNVCINLKCQVSERASTVLIGTKYTRPKQRAFKNGRSRPTASLFLAKKKSINLDRGVEDVIQLSIREFK